LDAHENGVSESAEIGTEMLPSIQKFGCQLS